MTEVHSIPEKFTTIQYVTKDGEKCTATKNNGVVTVVGDKNGVRQVPLNDFMKELVADLPQVDLARTPNKDTVQFSGQPEKTAEETPKTEVAEEEKEISEEKPNHLKKYLLTGAGVLAVVGTGLYLFGRGKWWSKAAKNLETKGQELADDFKQGIKNGGKKDPVAETPKTETPKVETPKTETSVTEVSEQEVVVTGKPVKKQPEIKTPKSPIPQEEIGKLPKDLELDISKISQTGKKELGGRLIIVKTDKGITRHYYLNADKTKIENVRDFNILPNGQIDFAPFRTIRFDKQTGQPSKIINKIDGMEDVITEIKPETPKVTPKVETPKSEPVKAKPKKEKPAEPKPEPKKEEDFAKQQEELNRQQEAIQRQQEETNNIILTGAALADPAVAGASERIAEAAGAVLKPEPIKIPKEAIEELAADIKLKPSPVTEDGAQAAEELFAHNPAKPKGTNVADDVSEVAESPKLEFEETKFTTQEEEIDDIIRSIDPDGSLEADFNSHNFGMDEFDSTIDNMTSSIDDLSSGFDDFTEGFFG